MESFLQIVKDGEMKIRNIFEERFEQNVSHFCEICFHLKTIRKIFVVRL